MSPRPLALLVVLLIGCATVSPTADAQRRDTRPSYTLMIGRAVIVYAAQALISGVPITYRVPLPDSGPVTLTGLTLPADLPSDLDCFLEELCSSGVLIYRESIDPYGTYCFRLRDLTITADFRSMMSGDSLERLEVPVLQVGEPILDTDAFATCPSEGE